MERLRGLPGFVAFWTADTVSAFGTYVTTVAIQVIVVLTLHEGAAGVGVVNAARWLPYLLFGLVAGALLDRVRRRPVLAATDLVRAGLLLVIPLLAVLDRLTLTALAVLMGVFGLVSLLNDAASQSFVPRLVPAALLTRANARLDQSDAAAQTSGPALGGALVTLLTAPWAVLVDAVSYLVSGLLILRVPVTEPPSRRASLRGLGGEVREGLRWVYRHRTLAPFAIGTHAWFLCSAVVGVVIPPFALRTLGLSAAGFGVVLAVAGAGGLLGALYAVRLGTAFGAGRVTIAAFAVTALAAAVFAASPNGLALGAGQFLLGFSIGVSNANSLGYRQAVTPDELQARMNATMRSINRAMVVVGAPLGGLLADGIGFRPVLAIAAAGFAVVAAVMWASPFRSARVEPVTGT